MIWNFVLWRIRRWRRTSFFIEYDIIENPNRFKCTWVDWTPATVATFRDCLRGCSQKAKDTFAIMRFLFYFNVCWFCYWGRVWRNNARLLFFLNFRQFVIFAFEVSNWRRWGLRRLHRIDENIFCQFDLNLVQLWVALCKECSLFWASIERVWLRLAQYMGGGRFWYLNCLDFLLD